MSLGGTLQNMAQSSGRIEHLPTGVGNPLPSIISIAMVSATVGGVLVEHAQWAGWQVAAGLFGYLAVSAIVAGTAGVGRRAVGFGLANQVTLVRAALVCMIGGALLAGGAAAVSGWSVPALVAIALSLDAVDGWLARRLRLTSRFGARFDLEVDALLLAILALLVWQAGRVGAWVLLIGLTRYLFVAARCWWPWLRAPLPPSRRRQTVCVQQGVTLLLCLLPPIDIMLAQVIAATALCCLLASFAVDVAHLRRVGARAIKVPDRQGQSSVARPGPVVGGSGGRPNRGIAAALPGDRA
jgi:phosphatidylglycerophosphate synthase